LKYTWMKVLPALVAASMLAACGGSGGVGGTALPNTAGGTSASPDASGDFRPTSAYRAVGDANTPIAYFAPNDGLWVTRGATQTRDARTASSSNNLIYGSGPVQTSPKIYVVYWGSSWNGSGDPDGMKSYLNSFYSHVGGTTWNATVTQYYQRNPSAYAGNPAGNYAGSYVDTSSTPPKRPSQSQMAAEAARAAAHFGNHTANAQYVVAMPYGIKPSGFGTQYCAYHSTTSAGGGTISWTNLPYLPDAGASCGAASVTGSNLDGVSIVAGHEMAESETDPQLSAWLDSSGEEIGDKCAWVNLADTNLNGTNFPTQPLWSNASSSCVQSY
jgi:hypothetical protein